MIYLDNSATTQLLPCAAQAVSSTLSDNFANPSSLHMAGLRAEHVVTHSRETIANTLGVSAAEVFFTSGATESNNTAVFGAARARKKLGSRIVTTTVEHPSVLRCFEALEAEGFEVKYVAPRDGRIEPEDVSAAIDKNTILVSMMAVNNETGDILPIDAAAQAIKSNGAPALLHCDAVQGYGKLALHPHRSCIDLMSISAHKLYGPKGVGAIYAAKGVHILPLLLGGGQENAMRSGTENVPGIAGFGAAAEEVFRNNRAFAASLQELGRYARDRFVRLGGVTLNSPENGAAHIINISVPPVASETMLHFLEAREIYVSAGSACSSHSAKGSRVLREYGIEKPLIDSALRISLGIYNTKEDIDILCEALKDCRERLAHK